jgi:hypothetical protein
MNRIGIFELHIQPGNELVPARVQIALQRHTARGGRRATAGTCMGGSETLSGARPTSP